MEKFRKLGISESILKTIKNKGFEDPSEIQEKSIPYVLEGKDVVAGASTGSGKTLAFATQILQNTEKGKGIQALILTPTRELANQITGALREFSKNNPKNILTIYGGVSINPQIQGAKKAEIVVGTPGRVLDHLQKKTLNLKKVKTLVLDEADRMLDMGFIDDVNKIISHCPSDRQSLLYSATITPDITRLGKKWLHNPVEISAKPHVDPSKLKQIFYDVPDNLKFSLFKHLIENEKSYLVMVFCNTRRNVDFVTNNLKPMGIDAIPIHGGFSQDKRDKTMNKFNSQKAHVLVATDVAARGLDIKGVSHVYNFDIPDDAKEYIHRIGRTARAGEEGIVINILSSRDYDNFRKVKSNPNLTIERQETPQIKRVRLKWVPKKRGGRRFDKKRNFKKNKRNNFRGHGKRSNNKNFRRGNNRHSNKRNNFKNNFKNKNNFKRHNKNFKRRH